jgi:menaquinone-dependent protoporphyrinogen IX oxidase
LDVDLEFTKIVGKMFTRQPYKFLPHETVNKGHAYATIIMNDNNKTAQLKVHKKFYDLSREHQLSVLKHEAIHIMVPTHSPRFKFYCDVFKAPFHGVELGSGNFRVMSKGKTIEEFPNMDDAKKFAQNYMDKTGLKSIKIRRRRKLMDTVENEKTHIYKGGLNMKGIVVYDTSHGNTKKIAETMVETLKESGIEVDLFHVKDAKLRADDYNFLIVGSPTRFGTMSFAIKFFLGKVKSEKWMNKPFAAFDTENPENIENARKENKEWSAGEKIAEKLREKKMDQLMPVLKALVIGQKGPIVEGEIERTKDYARELAVKLKEEKA